MHGSISKWTLLAALLPAALGCSESRATRVVLEVRADDAVQARASAVRLAVRGGVAPQTSEFVEVVELAEREWPLAVVLVPMGGDATRALDVSLDALDAQARVVARVRAAPSFVLGQTRRVELRFEAECLGVLACDARETCEAGRCVPVPVDPPPSDAGVPSDACTLVARYADRDGDGFGDPRAVERSCTPSPDRVLRADDCDDACADCHPGARESCDGARDEDCDGQVDEGCDCRLFDTRECDDGRDVCVRGVQSCIGGRWGECVGRVVRRPEECNARDDDCDGAIDEDVRRGCGRGCHEGCALGLWSECRDRDGDRCEHD